MKTRDVIISGGGIPGLILGCLLGQAGFDVCVIEPSPLPAPDKIKPSARTAALMNDSLAILDAACVWKNIEADATDLRTMSIIDHGVRADFKAEEIGQTRFGCNIVNAPLQAYAAENFRAVGQIYQSSLQSYEIENERVIATLEDGTALTASLLIGADGRKSRVRQIAGIEVRDHDYEQMAITALLEHTQPHRFISTEFHRPGGPFTLVPMPGNTSSLVWLEPSARAEELLKLNKKDFEQQIQDLSEGLLGEISLLTTPTAWPLRMMKAHAVIAERVVLIAEAAHVLSPIGAQGLNLSLRDVKALADILNEARENGLDFGSAATLDKYARTRAADTNFRVSGTHALNQLVATDNPVISSLRRAGLRAVSAFSPLRLLAMQKGLTGGDDQDKMSGRTTRAKVKTSTR